MQSISEVLQNQNLTNSGQNLPQTLSAEPSLNTCTPIRRERVTQFFLQMAAIYPYRWMGQFADSKAMQVAVGEWLKAMHGFEEPDIERGLNFCRSKGGEFPPSIPEFVKMCTPTLEEFGILNREEAYQAFCAKDYSNHLVSITEKKLQPHAFDMAQMWAKDHKREFLNEYDICVKNYIEQNLPLGCSENCDNQSNKKRLMRK